MNVEAMEWARAQTSLSILQKSILAFLASIANDGMLVESESQKAIASAVGCSRSAANRALRALELRGRIGIVRFFGVDDGQLPCAYVLNCAEEEMSEGFAFHLLMEWHRRNRRRAA